jgi:hypothetical protein
MICVLANRHKRYGVGMIYRKLRQAGHMVNYKRVERLYQADRQPLLRPAAANEVWSIDFVLTAPPKGAS